ncbi:hypothetical protein [Paraburkholderia aromaticivorans]|uniref:hypothetical protein n=1 Tax=Paraburkholderia aromaticivorans TaxID=2026199 RepID=UPI0012FD5802|nr:hypothetical protein [Paraburkholderia aromaticivorans]
MPVLMIRFVESLNTGGFLESPFVGGFTVLCIFAIREFVVTNSAGLLNPLKARSIRLIAAKGALAH